MNDPPYVLTDHAPATRLISPVLALGFAAHLPPTVRAPARRVHPPTRLFSTLPYTGTADESTFPPRCGHLAIRLERDGTLRQGDVPHVYAASPVYQHLRLCVWQVVHLAATEGSEAVQLRE
jgi:hypothetical protein